MTEVTYRDFSRLAKKRGWTVEMLVELFKGKTGIEDRRDEYHEPLASYYERVLSCQWLNPEDPAHGRQQQRYRRPPLNH